MRRAKMCPPPPPIFFDRYAYESNTAASCTIYTDKKTSAGVVYVVFCTYIFFCTLLCICSVCRNDVKSRKEEIWFDDVDTDDLDKVTGVKQRKVCEGDVHTRTLLSQNEVQVNETKEQEPRYHTQMKRFI